MNKIIATIVCVGSILLMPLISSAASTPADVLASLQTAREKLVALIGATDKEDQAELQEAIKTATKGVDEKVAAILADAGTAAAVKGKITEFKAVWESFKQTRDTEIIPAVLAGDKEKAKGIAQGIQAERFKKMLSLLQ